MIVDSKESKQKSKSALKLATVKRQRRYAKNFRAQTRERPMANVLQSTYAPSDA
jgi:predicted DNA-binding WGR domain protein